MLLDTIMFLYPVSFQWLARATAMIAVATAYHYAGQAMIRRDDRPIWYCRVECNREAKVVGVPSALRVLGQVGSDNASATTVSFFAATKDATSFPFAGLSGHDRPAKPGAMQDSMVADLQRVSHRASGH